MATQEETDSRYMRMALEEARAALMADEVPIGAVVVANGQVIGRGHNMTETLGDVTAHAEMLAITAATQTINGKYLTGATIYVTVEPCLMCAGAIAWSQLSRIVYGASDPKRGYSSYLTATAPAAATSDGSGRSDKSDMSDMSEGSEGSEGSDSAARIAPHPFHPKATVTSGILADECSNLMREFFRSKR